MAVKSFIKLTTGQHRLRGEHPQRPGAGALQPRLRNLSGRRNVPGPLLSPNEVQYFRGGVRTGGQGVDLINICTKVSLVSKQKEHNATQHNDIHHNNK
jgi:hypothetical protein